LGLSGRVPPRVDAATKAGLLDLVCQAVAAGWEFRAACQVLELGTVRAYRWLGRRAADELADRRPGGSQLHGLLPDEVAEIVALFHQWGETDRSHRKLAHRGSYLERVWVSPASVRRVLEREGVADVLVQVEHVGAERDREEQDASNQETERRSARTSALQPVVHEDDPADTHHGPEPEREVLDERERPVEAGGVRIRHRAVVATLS
jgi:hypothetical protein